MRFNGGRFEALGMVLSGLRPLVDGEPASDAEPKRTAAGLEWATGHGRFGLTVSPWQDGLRLTCSLSGIDPARSIDSLGLRFGRIEGTERYLRHGYQSWDGSMLLAPGTPRGDGPSAKSPALGFAATALMPRAGDGAVVLGFTRHDRFQSRFRFGGSADAMALDVETLWDRVPHDGAVEAEPLVLFEGQEPDAALRRWAKAVAADSSLPPRVPRRRITGWCSWYNLYAAIDEPAILEHLSAAAAFRDAHGVPLDIFQIDDGFTPEMGDWLNVKPQFPRGMGPLLADIRAAGFTPGLWIAPFLVGNRSRLYRDHPDWVVGDRQNGGPLIAMRFYGEFRWHKRSEEYFVLDVTHPHAAAYIAHVFRTWAHDWGVRYFKADFLHFGAEWGPNRAVWHTPGLSRIQVWRRMAAIMREEIGEDAVLVGSGSPLWAATGIMDAVRIGRDVGVKWAGEQSAESLLRDQVTRGHAAGVLWASDPDCVLLRDRFHELSDAQINLLARFAGLSGGVLMTSDHLGDLPPARAALLAELLRMPVAGCRYPGMGDLQVATLADGREITSRLSS